MKQPELHGAIIVAAVVLAIGLAIGLSNVGEKKSDYITVGGQSEVAIQPDRAVLHFSINTHEETAEQAQATDAAATQRLQEALKAHGGVETANYWLNRRTEWTGNGTVERGYDLYHTFKVTTTVPNAGRAIESAVGAGANGVDRIEFLVSQEAKSAAVAEAMTKASVFAQENARQVTDGMGVGLGRVLKIEESGYWIVPSSEPADTGSVPAEYQGNVIAPQRMAVQANVNVVFEVN